MKHITIHSAVGVNTGNIRENNEDNFYFNGIHLNKENREIPVQYAEKRTDDLQIYAVCDGMGGEARGEDASLIAVETLAKYQNMLSSNNIHDFDKYIEMYLLEASNSINEKSKDIGYRRIGTTIALLCVVKDKICIYNIGDSRVYRLHRNKLTQMTEDHTQAMRAVRMGTIKPKDAKNHPHRNKLTQYLGVSTAEMIIKPSISCLDAVDNDMYLLCSDGITDMIDDDDIKKIMKHGKTEKDIVNELIEKAKNNGGRDNITAIVLRIDAKKSWFK